MEEKVPLEFNSEGWETVGKSPVGDVGVKYRIWRGPLQAALTGNTVTITVRLYYSLADWRFPAYFNGPVLDPKGFSDFRDYIHGQVRELCANYGKIDVLWFDGVWPHPAEVWRSRQLIRTIRRLQPDILINNRLGGGTGAGQGGQLGDFGTPEHHITADPHRMWESCQVTTWRLWGYTKGERWRPADLLVDMLCEAAGKGGNLLLNVGPKPDGTFPRPFLARMAEIGRWMKQNGEAIYGSEPGDVCEFVTHGRQIVKGNTLYLMIRFWPGSEVHLAGLKTEVLSARLLATGQPVRVDQQGEHLYLRGLPKQAPDRNCTVIALTCREKPAPFDWAKGRLWQGDPTRMAAWAAS